MNGILELYFHSGLIWHSPKCDWLKGFFYKAVKISKFIPYLIFHFIGPMISSAY